MRGMFWSAVSFNQDLSGWNVSQVTSMRSMFLHAHAFNGNISGWDTSQVADMAKMFDHAHAFNGNISGWDVSQVRYMFFMFHNATDFNQDLAGWDISQVTELSWMFDHANAFNGNISGWDVSHVADVTGMFRGATAFNQDMGKWLVALSGTHSFDSGATTPVVIGTLSPQSRAFGSPTYSIDTTHGDHQHFSIDGSNQLILNDTAKSYYDIRITTDHDLPGNPPANNRDHTNIFNITSDTLQPLTAKSLIPDSTPVITVLGESLVVVPLGSTYQDAGATCLAGSVDLTASMTVSSSVNTAVPGTYQVFYKCGDISLGALSAALRVVLVVDPAANGPPVSEAGPDQTVLVNSMVVLDGSSSSDPDEHPVSYLWAQDSGHPVSLSDPASPRPSFTAPPHPANLTFRLGVSDGLTTTNDTVAIMVVEQPPIADDTPPSREITGLALTSSSPGTIAVSWSAPEDDPTRDYRVSWAKTGEPFTTWTDTSGNAFTTSTAKTITGLEEGAEYKVKVRARYADGGPGPWSETLTITTAASAPAPPPPTEQPPGDQQEPPSREITGLALTSSSPGTIAVSWSAPEDDPTRDYRVSWAKTGEPFTTWTDTSGNAFTTSTAKTITGLEEGAEYKVKVRARYADGGPGPWSETLTITTAASSTG